MTTLIVSDVPTVIHRVSDVPMELLLTVLYECCPRILLRVVPLQTRWMALSRKPHFWNNYLNSVDVTIDNSPQERYHTLLVELARCDQFGHLVGLMKVPGVVYELRSLAAGVRAAVRAGHGQKFIRQVHQNCLDIGRMYHEGGLWEEYQNVIEGRLRYHRSRGTVPTADDMEIYECLISDLLHVLEMELAAERNEWEAYHHGYMRVTLRSLSRPFQAIVRSISRTTDLEFYRKAVKLVTDHPDYTSRIEPFVPITIHDLIIRAILCRGQFEFASLVFDTEFPKQHRDHLRWHTILASDRPDALELYRSTLSESARVELAGWLSACNSAIGNGVLLERYVQEHRILHPVDVLEVVLLSYRTLPPERYMVLIEPLLKYLKNDEISDTMIELIRTTGHTYIGNRLREYLDKRG